MTADGAMTFCIRSTAARMVSVLEPLLFKAHDGQFTADDALRQCVASPARFQMTADASTVTILRSFAGGASDGPHRRPRSHRRSTAHSTERPRVAASTMPADLQNDRQRHHHGLMPLARGKPHQATDGNFYGTARDSFSRPGVPCLQLREAGRDALTADFDGDGKADLVVYRPATGEWFVRYSLWEYSYDNYATCPVGCPGRCPARRRLRWRRQDRFGDLPPEHRHLVRALLVLELQLRELRGMPNGACLAIRRSSRTSTATARRIWPSIA